MHILAFTDPHANGEYLEAVRKKAEKADLLVCCGDFTVFHNGMEEVLGFLDTIGKKVLIVHGNHEDEGQVGALCRASKHLVFLHKNTVSIKGITFLGYGGGGFGRAQPVFEVWVRTLKLSGKTVLVTHQPPHGTKVDFLGWAGHVGSKSFRQFIEEFQPKLVLCGHLHETFHQIDKMKDTVVFNPGPDGSLIEI